MIWFVVRRLFLRSVCCKEGCVKGPKSCSSSSTVLNVLMCLRFTALEPRTESCG